MEKKVLVLIIIFALALRLFRLESIPNGFFFDEATIAYQAYSIVKTGHDTWNNFFPVFAFKDYGEYILPVGVYGQAVFTILGGLNIFISRLPHALLGTFLILLVFILGKQFFGGKVGILSALLLAFQPLAFGWSRFVFEGNFGTVLFLLGIIFLLRNLPISIFFFGLSMLTYHVFLFVVPVFVFCALILLRKERKFKRKSVILSILVATFFVLWASGSILTGSGRARFNQAVTLITTEKIDVLNHNRGYCETSFPRTICRIFLNKATVAIGSYMENYASHFSPQFLGFDGTFLRKNVLPRAGIIQVFEVIAFYMGVLMLIRKFSLASKIILLCLLIYPLANSFTGVGEISRIVFASPIFALVSAFGLINFKRKSRHIFFLVLSLILIGAAGFMVTYFSVFPKSNAYYSNYGYDKVFAWVSQNKSRYERIFLSRSYSGSVPYISALFFLPVDPSDFNNGEIDRRRDDMGYFLTDRIGNLLFYQKISDLNFSKDDFIIATPEEFKNVKYTSTFEIVDPTGRLLLIGVEGRSINVKEN